MQHYDRPLQSYGGLYQDRYRFVDGESPAEATNAPYEPEYEPIRGEIAGRPSSFAAHGIGGDTLGSYPGGGRSTLIPSTLAGPQIVSPARVRDGYDLRGAGTPEPAINAPKRGAGLEYRNGTIRVGMGPAIPVALLAILGGAAYLYRRER